MQKKAKSRRRNQKGRKNPKFAEAIILMFRDAHVTIEELTEKKPTKEFDEATGRMKATYDQLPDGCTVVDTMGGHAIFKDERLFRHLDRIAMALHEFDSDFWSDEGLPVRELRLDKKGRLWGNEIAILSLAYLAIAAGMAEWTQPRDQWRTNEDQMPRIRFTKGEQDEQIEQPTQSEPKVEQHTDGAASV